MLARLKSLAANYRRPLRWLLWIAFSLLLLIAIFAGLTRTLGATLVARYQPQVTTLISQQLKLPVRVGALTLDWHGLNPELVLNDIQVSDNNTPAASLLTIKHLALRLSLVNTLINRRLMAKSVLLQHVIVKPGLYQALENIPTNQSSNALPWDKLWIQLEDLNTPVDGKLPGLTNFNVSVQLHQQQGQFTVSDDAWTLNMPWLFRQPLNLKDTDLNGHVKFGKHAFSLSIADGAVSVPEGDIMIQLALRVPKTGSTTINLDARGNFENLTRRSVYNYMPIAVLSPSLLQWLDTSILGVTKAESHFVLRGNMADFPFVNKPGKFLVDSTLQGASLAFASSWPKATNINARMVFSGQSMLINADKGQFAGLTMQNATVGIPVMAVGQPVILNVATLTQGDAEAIIKAIDAIPIKSISRLSEMLQGKGPMTVSVNVKLPLENVTDMAPSVSGYAKLEQVNVQSGRSAVASLTGLTGTLNFSDQGLSSKALQGQWQGMPITIALGQGGTPGLTSASAVLQLSALKLKPMLPVAWANTLKGQTKVTLQMLASLADVPSIKLSTNVQGMSIALPPPFNKAATASVPSQMIVKHLGNNNWQITANYGPTVNLQAAIAAGKQQNQLTALSLGWGSPVTLTPQQITVVLNQNKVDLTPWITLFKQRAGTSATPAVPLPLQLKIITPQLVIPGYSLTGVNLQTNYDGKQLGANIVSKELTGTINYQLPRATAKEQLQVNLKQLILGGSSLSSSGNTMWKRFPATRFSCQYLQIGKLSLGQVNVALTPTTGGLNINQMKLTTKAITINANGSWLWQTAKTQLTGTLSTGNLSQALRDLGLSGNIDANSANVQFKLAWPGAPWQMGITALQGTANLNIGPGKITGLSQSADASVGLGKVISLLSIEGLMRIGDLTQEGFAFDKVTGQFQFNQGSVQVIQSEIKGVVADLFFEGQIGLTQKNYNLRMQAVGRLTSSLPVVATIAGGPVVGAVTWVVNKAVGPAVDKMGSSNYQITGTWQKPVISKAR